MIKTFKEYYWFMRYGGDGVITSFLFAAFIALAAGPVTWYLDRKVYKTEDFGSFEELKAQRDEHGIVRRKTHD